MGGGGTATLPGCPSCVHVTASVLAALHEQSHSSGTPVDHLVEHTSPVPRSRAPHAAGSSRRAGGGRVPGGGVGRGRARARRLRARDVRGPRRRDDRARRSRVPGRVRRTRRRGCRRGAHTLHGGHPLRRAVTRHLPHVDGFSTLTDTLDGLRRSANVFYAPVRVDGAFDAVHVRAACRTAPGVPLVIATESQAEFDLGAVRGTMVGFWSPPYTSRVEIVGYHLHFLSDDRTGGRARARLPRRRSGGPPPGGMRRAPGPPRHDCVRDADLTRDPTADLDRAEH